MTLAELHTARTWLLAEHAQADARRNHGRKRWIRTTLGAVEAVIAASTPVQPVRVERPMLPATVQGDFRETRHVGRINDTAIATLYEARP